MNHLQALLADAGTWHSNGAWCITQRYPALRPEKTGRDLGHRVHPDWRERLRVLVLSLQSSNRLGIVLCRTFIRALRESGVEIPETPVGEQSRGAVGLAVDRDTREAFLVPIHATKHEPGAWKSDPGLPFGDCRRVRDLLIRFADSLGTPEACLGTARSSFHFRGGLDLGVTGGSMDLAAVLAMVRSSLPPGCVNANLLDTCVSIVQPLSETGEDLAGVEFEHEKMAAFARECDGGSLLVAHPESLSARKHGHLFGNIWLVRTLGELAERLQSAGLLQGLLITTPLSEQDVMAVKLEAGRLARRMEIAKVGRLCRAALAVGTGPDVPASLTASLHGRLSACLRQQGNFIDAMVACCAAGAAGKRWSTHEQRLLQACELAWCLADAHRFQEAANLLEEHASRLDQDPGAFSPAAKRNLWNAQGRILALCGKPRKAWQDCFTRTLELQQEWDPGSMGRTRVYLSKSLGNAGLHGEAREILTEGVASGEMWSTWTDRCLHALEDGAGGRVTDVEPAWESCDLGAADMVRGYLFLFLATQPARKRESSARLLRIAERVFLRTGGETAPPAGLPTFFGAACRLARTSMGDQDGHFPWLGRFRAELAGSAEWSAIRDHYGAGGSLLEPGWEAESNLGMLRKIPIL